MKKILVGIVAVIAVFTANAAGFALYEGSTKATAFGGAVIGKAADASANFFNPATMTDFTNTVVTVGFITEHPTADISVNGHHENKMNAGCFTLPHAYLVQPLTEDLYFGFGFAPEFGLGTHYNGTWALREDTLSTTLKGLAINPNVAYRITKKWTVALGIRLMYLEFEQDKMVNATIPGSVLPGGGSFTGYNHLEGDNGMIDWGWEVATKYDITEKLSVGAVYKSYINCRIKGHNTLTGSANANLAMVKPYESAVSTAIMAANSGSGAANVRLPDSITVGANYDVTDDLHLGTVFSWTHWSTLGNIHFELPGGDVDQQLHWRDTYRIGGGIAYDFNEYFTGLISYVYDTNPCRRRYGSTMLPGGVRHVAAIGFTLHWKGVEITPYYGAVFMAPEALEPGDGRDWKFDTHRGISHSGGVTISYYF